MLALLQRLLCALFQVVNILYRENDWVYVIAADSRQEGFIPHSYCTPYNSHLGELALSNVKKKLPREQRNGSLNPSATIGAGEVGANDVPDLQESRTAVGNGDISDCESYGKKITVATTQQLNMTSSQASLHSVSSSQPDIHPFFKDPSGRYIVLYTFIARDENDVSVERGEFVTVLNREDPDWYWIVRSDGQEGFVPSGFVYPAHVIQGELSRRAGSKRREAIKEMKKKKSEEANRSKTTLETVNKLEAKKRKLLQQAEEEASALKTEIDLEKKRLRQITSDQDSNPDLPFSNLVYCKSETLDHAATDVGHLNNSNNQNVNNNFPSSTNAHLLTSPSNDDLRYHGTELVMLYDYKAQAPDDLSVRRGDWIYADLNNQTVDGWLWAYAPKTRKYGFIPKAYARPPAMTSL
uniref:(California timema) hypothetical protein n=1 Tax=Timema californicum TaxID=61474 RepID=A0A7R9J876_TIMCA|nr:unnamed protein product [Timema californicum]